MITSPITKSQQTKKRSHPASLNFVWLKTPSYLYAPIHDFGPMIHYYIILSSLPNHSHLNKIHFLQIIIIFQGIWIPIFTIFIPQYHPHCLIHVSHTQPTI
mmetsp:Transcript_29035/g.34517  ORF Transcript_29035/g.34517 Transcript_29035/m.34517 type:complete len:101 (+) Transcript_29035:62-364(+)